MYYNNTPQKIHLARRGYNPLFGKDVDVRENMTNEEALRRFESIWQRELKGAVVGAERCDPENALTKLNIREKEFFDETQEHREFICKDGLFVAQLKTLAQNSYELTQLWFIRSSNVDPRTLFVTFETVAKRQGFKEMCEGLGWKDEDLGKRILIDLMDNPDDISWRTVLKRILLRK